MINLNEVKEKSISIFNGGEAGVAKGKLTKVEKKQPGDAERSPDFKVFFEDKEGETNIAFFVPDGQDEVKSNRELARLLSLARAYFGDDFEFPKVKNYNEAYSVVLKMLKKECVGEEFNLFVCYGYDAKPSSFLGVRKFDFVESGKVSIEDSKLEVKKSDVMERLQPDGADNKKDSIFDESMEELGDDFEDDDDIV